MAWKEVSPMEERVRFVCEASRGCVSFSHLCREYGISRKTGYKWFSRFRSDGIDGMYERSSRPLSSPNKLSDEVVTAIIKERSRHGTWGPKKLRELLVCNYEFERVPAASTIGEVLCRFGLTAKRRRRRVVREPKRKLTSATRPNEVWAVDFKGWFRTRDGQRCDPLTVSDLYSRYVLGCEVLPSQRHTDARPAFERLFRRRGLPEIIRSDNGSPFGSRGVCGLSQLSAWWSALGIEVEFIEPGHPEQNGVHERMHRTLKAETVRPPAATPKAQQRRFNEWRREFNTDRPHEALGMRKPAQRYERSAQRYHGIAEDFGYPAFWNVRRVKSRGEIKWQNRLRYVGEALRGLPLGIWEVSDGCHEVYLRDLLLGYLMDHGEKGLVPEPTAGTPSSPPRGATTAGLKAQDQDRLKKRRAPSG